MKRIIVLGATSGIAEAVERKMAAGRHELLLVARSPERLAVLREDLLIRGATQVLTFVADFDSPADCVRLFDFARQSFPDFDTVLLAYGSMPDQEQCKHSIDLTARQLHTDFVSAACILTLFADYLEERKTGCLAVITSVAGDRGRRSNYVYGSAKGGLSHFLEGLRARLHASGVRVITIKPGPVDTKMTAHLPRDTSFASPMRVASDIYRSLQRGRPDILYTPRYWRYVMLCVRALPEWIFKRQHKI
ncbi:MAG TPA: SDR family NAD(P)-dependent oxidoreductase [Candidatus Angelobacter sp.]|nr:SDR family NAD(P)-dependent oxidoreductase [Candidatus Angelobacter sp.]